MPWVWRKRTGEGMGSKAGDCLVYTPAAARRLTPIRQYRTSQNVSTCQLHTVPLGATLGRGKVIAQHLSGGQ